MQCFFVASSSLAACKRIEKTTRKPKHRLASRNLATQPSSQKESPRTFSKGPSALIGRTSMRAPSASWQSCAAKIWFRWNAMRTRTAREVVATCEYCRLHQDDSPLAALHVEHIIPKIHGGTDDRMPRKSLG